MWSQELVSVISTEHNSLTFEFFLWHAFQIAFSAKLDLQILNGRLRADK